MLAGLAISFILLNTVKEDFKWKDESFLDDLLEKKLIEEMDFDSKKTNEHVKVNLQTFKGQITNEFEDKLGRNCISLQTGLKYEWYFYKSIEFPARTLMNIYSRFGKRIRDILGYILLSRSKNLEFIGGFCYNHSHFIDASELEDVLHKPKDKYLWFKYPENMELQSKDIFKLFPKDLITLASKDYVYDL